MYICPETMKALENLFHEGYRWVATGEDNIDFVATNKEMTDVTEVPGLNLRLIPGTREEIRALFIGTKTHGIDII